MLDLSTMLKSKIVETKKKSFAYIFNNNYFVDNYIFQHIDLKMFVHLIKGDIQYQYNVYLIFNNYHISIQGIMQAIKISILQCPPICNI